MQQYDGQWRYSPEHGQLCQVIEAQTHWGETVCRVWLPGRDSVVCIPASRLKPLENASIGSPDDIAYVVAAARVADALALSVSNAQAGVMLAPMAASVIPLPHQLRALSRAIANDRVRYLLADEVGLGKTIEAGLIMQRARTSLPLMPGGCSRRWLCRWIRSSL